MQRGINKKLSDVENTAKSGLKDLETNVEYNQKGITELTKRQQEADQKHSSLEETVKLLLRGIEHLENVPSRGDAEAAAAAAAAAPSSPPGSEHGGSSTISSVVDRSRFIMYSGDNIPLEAAEAHVRKAIVAKLNAEKNINF